MGQATAADDAVAADLPDPNEAAAPASPLASADDLLAQLAGEEIDRLLAESEADAVARTKPPSNEPTETAAPTTSPAAPAATEAPAAPAADATDSVDAEIDRVLNQAQPAPAAPTAGQPEPELQPANPTIAAMADDQTAAAEMQELLDMPDPSPGTTDVADDRMPLYVRMLMLLNAPLDHLPEAIREMVGKIAILTLFNAVAVLLYVLIFRRH